MKKLLLFASLIGLASSASAQFTNGSFESASVNPGGFTTLATGDTAISGWVITGHSVDYIGTYWTASNGSRSIDLAGNGPGGVSQTFATGVGTQYLVSFDLAGNPDALPNPKTMLVDVSVGAYWNSFSFNTTGSSRGAMNWTPYSFVFTANQALTTLSFSAGADSASWGPALDNVSVSLVPEPSTYAVLASIAMLGFAAYRRFRRS